MDVIIRDPDYLKETSFYDVPENFHILYEVTFNNLAKAF